MTKTLVLGGTGFLGKHLCNAIGDNVISVGSMDADLTRRADIKDLLSMHQPNRVFHLAAYVGGIGLNQKHPGKMFYENMLMGINVVEAFKEYSKSISYYTEEKPKLIITGTVCMYPKHCPTPFKESDIWEGYPEETNAPYGIAKKALMVMAEAYTREFDIDITFAIPSNLYGPEDHFDLENSHVIPAMIRKFHEAKVNKEKEVVLWGTGSPTREFLYVGDCAKALLFLGSKYKGFGPINIASSNSISIKNLANKIKEIVGYSGRIVWDTNKPDGQPIREVSNQLLLDAGYSEEWSNFDEGLKRTYEWYRSAHEKH